MKYNNIQKYYNHRVGYMISQIKKEDWNKLPSIIQEGWYNETLKYAKLSSINAVDFAKKFYNTIKRKV